MSTAVSSRVAAAVVVIAASWSPVQAGAGLQPPGTAPASASSELAAELSSALEAAGLDSIAAPDPAGDGRYVAVLRFPTMLLVVSARYEVPMYIDEKISAGAHREVYMDLNTASIAGSKVLVTDTGAKGLGDAGDSVDLRGDMLRFSESSAQHDEASTAYIGMLRALTAAVP